MITVFQVDKAGEESTRLFLPQTAWGERILDALHEQGYRVSQAADQTQFPDPREPDELTRRDALLDLAEQQGNEC